MNRGSTRRILQAISQRPSAVIEAAGNHTGTCQRGNICIPPSLPHFPSETRRNSQVLRISPGLRDVSDQLRLSLDTAGRDEKDGWNTSYPSALAARCPFQDNQPTVPIGDIGIVAHQGRVPGPARRIVDGKQRGSEGIGDIHDHHPPAFIADIGLCAGNRHPIRDARRVDGADLQRVLKIGYIDHAQAECRDRRCRVYLPRQPHR